MNIRRRVLWAVIVTMALALTSCEPSRYPKAVAPVVADPGREVTLIQKIRRTPDKADMAAYLDDFPQGQHRTEVLGYLEEHLWQEVEASSRGKLEGRLRVYLNRFPGGQYAEVAQSRLPEARQLAIIDQHQRQADIITHLDQFPRSQYRVDMLRLLDKMLWDNVQAADETQLISLEQIYRTYFPPHHAHVQATQRRLNIAHHLRRIRQDKSVDDMVSYLQDYPQEPHRAEVLGHLERALWKEVEAAGTNTIESSVKLYLEWFATGPHAEEARHRLEVHHTSQEIEREQQLIATIRQDRRESDMRLYLNTYPKGQYRQEVLPLLESHLWQMVQTSHRPELETLLHAYLDEFPQGKYAATARNRLKHEQLITTIQQYKRRQDMISYLEKFPGGSRRDQVTAMLEADLWRAVESASQSEREQRVAAYLTRFPSGPHSATALAFQRQIDACKAAEAADTYRHYKAYLKAYPQGFCSGTARRRITLDYWQAKPKTAHVYRQIAASYAAYPTHDVGKAILYYHKAIGLDENDVDSFVQLGKLYADLKDMEKAKTNFIQVITLDPKNHESHKQLGEIYQSQNKPRKAIRHYGKAIEANPYCMICYRRLGRLRWTLLDRKQAFKDFHNLKKLGKQYLTRKNLDEKERKIIKGHIGFAEGFLKRSNQ